MSRPINDDEIKDLINSLNVMVCSRITMLEQHKDLLLAELEAARDALRNDFEPDNQSRAYKRAAAAVSVFQMKELT